MPGEPLSHGHSLDLQVGVPVELEVFAGELQQPQELLVQSVGTVGGARGGRSRWARTAAMPGPTSMLV